MGNLLPIQDRGVKQLPQDFNFRGELILLTYYKGGDLNGRRNLERLVAEAFVENLREVEQVDHINNDKSDNRACNLQWI